MQDVIHAGHKADEIKAYKPDNILGICEAVGNDLGFNPTWLRIAFLPILFFAPMVMIGAYLGLGVVVLASRLIFPKPRVAQVGQRAKQAELFAA
jgi:phage shock protein PspC (stress-responsive transcriptional regulator)